MRPESNYACMENNPGLLSIVSSGLVGRNITVTGKRTSIRLEPAMWDALHDIAERERMTIHQIASQIDRHRCQTSSLTAAIRVFILEYYRVAATEGGHRRAGHGRGDILGTQMLRAVG